MTKFNACKAAALLLSATMAIAAPAQIVNTLLSFDVTDGQSPYFVTLVQGLDGNFYGTTLYGGTGSECISTCGTVVKITPSGGVAVLHTFSGPDGELPFAGLVLASDGNFYGTTEKGGLYEQGDNPAGTIFRITPDGQLTTLYNFCAQSNCIDGEEPCAALVQATDGNLYGTTWGGGANGLGTVFRITLAGQFSVLHSFDSADGEFLAGPPLIQATDGLLYGTTGTVGAPGSCPDCGAVFQLTLDGKFTTLHNFDGSDGSGPSSLMQSVDGDFYGTTGAGGSAGYGTIFRMKANGAVETLYNFSQQDGRDPTGPLLQATDGNFYFTLSTDDVYYCGALFGTTPGGATKILYRFSYIYQDGYGCNPDAGLLQSTNGSFYGTTVSGGFGNAGSIFTFSMELGPFVTFARPAAKVDEPMGILGQGLLGTTSVLLNGVQMDFKVNSDTFVEATFPSGDATTGPVTVNTPGGILTSNVPFRVLPQILNFTPPSGPIGTQVTITGVSFTQTQGVGFGDHIPAQFTVNSDTQLTVIVPAGAKTGRVRVQTLGGVVYSEQTFTVTP
jgi:uncharacterized repeat protein (TIGR03803 family)